MPTDNVGFVRKEVRDQLTKWSLIRDCLEGQERIKFKETTYLPKPNASDLSQENVQRYKSYLERAVFYNVTRRTLDGLVGQVFMRDPVISDFPEKLHELLKVDVDGSGVGLNEQAKKTLADTMSFGRVGILVDYPNLADPVTVAEQEKGYIRPTIVTYQPEQVINWRTKTVGGRKIFSLVVLVEEYTQEDDSSFEPTIDIQWRVLRLENGFYTVELWREASVTQEGKQAVVATLVEKFVPKDFEGQPFSEIPFSIIGSVNNDPVVDPPPLYDLAVLNIAHYRNSADYEESCFLVGQPTVYVAGLTESWVSSVLKGEVQMGSRALIPLPEGGSAGLLQVSPNSMPKEGMEQKERQMVALGARLVEQRNVQRTLGEAQQEESGETSILASVAKNVSAAYSFALNWCLRFTGGATEKRAVYDLNTDFIASRLTPEERAQLVAEWQSAAISFTEMRRQLRKAGIATLDDEDAKDEAEEDPNRQGPKLLNPGNSLTGGANNGRGSPTQNGKTQQQQNGKPA